MGGHRRGACRAVGHTEDIMRVVRVWDVTADGRWQRRSVDMPDDLPREATAYDLASRLGYEPAGPLERGALRVKADDAGKSYLVIVDLNPAEREGLGFEELIFADDLPALLRLVGELRPLEIRA